VRIGIIGTGYVGLVYGTVMANFGHSVICMDKDKQKVNQLRMGESPIYEPELLPLLRFGLEYADLSFTDSLEECIEYSDVIVITIGTPTGADGTADVSGVMTIAESIGKLMMDDKLVVCKSTVPMGTSRRIIETIKQRLQDRKVGCQIEVVCNPEFLRQGKAVEDCISPSRVIIGTETEHAKQVMQDIYRLYDQEKTPFLYTGFETAEMIKYASNSFLAVKISFANELSWLSETAGADIQDVVRGMGFDERISPAFLEAGAGYGGSCFPKDTRAIVETGIKYNAPLRIVEAAIAANETQKARMVWNIQNTLSELGEPGVLTVGVLGLSFKPETDDIRCAPSYDIIKGLIDHGFTVKVYCPKGMRQAKSVWTELNERIHYCESEEDCADFADALVIVTEWNHFRNLEWSSIRAGMRHPYLFDLRNMFHKESSVTGLFRYYAVGAGA
jgi:UDPglucose 6-dehydrogenase